MAAPFDRQRDRIGEDIQQQAGLGGAVRGISQAGVGQPRRRLPALQPTQRTPTPGVGGPAIAPPGPTAPVVAPPTDFRAAVQQNVVTGGGGRPGIPQIQPPSTQPGTAINPNDPLRSRAFLPPEDVSLDPATQRARELVSGGLENLQGPDRAKLAMDAFQRFQEQGDPAYQTRLREVGQKAAALGRIGAGMTTSDLGDVNVRREQELLREQGRLSGEAAGLSLQDRLAAQSGLESGAGTLAGLGGEEFNRGIQQRHELRGERGYQGDLAERAQQARIDQERAEFDRQQQETENKLREQQILSGLVQGSPYSPYAGLQGASQLGGGGGTADFFSQLAQQGGGGAQPQAPVAAPPGGFGGQVPGIFEGESLGRRRFGLN